jgi:hypothetical protein
MICCDNNINRINYLSTIDGIYIYYTQDWNSLKGIIKDRNIDLLLVNLDFINIKECVIVHELCEIFFTGSIIFLTSKQKKVNSKKIYSTECRFLKQDISYKQLKYQLFNELFSSESKTVGKSGSGKYL